MPVRCPQCRKEYDVVQLEAASRLKCRCGFMLDLSLVQSVEDFLRYSESKEEREKAIAIQKDAQAICRMILNEECPGVDIEIAKRNLEEKAERLFPDKMEVYRMIYESRFNRLWEQFRSSD